MSGNAAHALQGEATAPDATEYATRGAREHKAARPHLRVVGPLRVERASRGTFALLVISCLVLIAAYPDSLHDVDRTVHIAPPGPRLQTNPGDDLKDFRAQEQKQLETYYWVDREKGLVHIPIEQAMKTLVQTGIPGFPKAQP